MSGAEPTGLVAAGLPEPAPAPLPVRTVASYLRRSFGAVLVVMLAAGGAGIAAAVVTGQHVEALVSELDPVSDANRDALQAMVEAQTAVRGYLLTGRGDLLGPYRQAPDRVNAALQAATRAAPADVRARLVREQQLATRWVAAYDDLTATTAAVPPTANDRVAASTPLFEEFRAANQQVQHLIQARRTDLTAQGQRLLSWSVWGVCGILLIGLVAGALSARATARALVRPLEQLRRVVDRRAQGDRSARADAGIGPAEVRAVAAAVNTLAEETARLRAAEREADRLRDEASAASRAVRAHLDRASVIQTAVTSLGRALEADRVWLREVQGEQLGPVDSQWHREGLDLLEDIAAVDPDTETAVTLARRLWASGGVLDVSATADNPLFDTDRGQAFLRATHAGSLLSLPVGDGADLLAIITVVMVGRPRRWTPDETAMVRSIAAELGRALRHAQLYAHQEALVDQLRELDREKTVFLSTVSHELRTPLTSIAGYLELIRDGDAGPISTDLAGMLDVVGRNSTRLSLLIEDLLTLSRIEAGEFQIGRSQVPLAAVLAAVDRTMQPVARAAGVRLRVETPAELIVDGDEAQLERAVLNLVGNAVKFTPQGGVVEVQAVSQGDQIEVLVSDTGIGIPDAEQARLWERFYRASNATSRSVPGTGLGLPIVRTIVELHGGSLALTSAENEGTTVTIRLPRLDGSGPRAGGEAREHARTPAG